MVFVDDLHLNVVASGGWWRAAWARLSNPLAASGFEFRVGIWSRTYAAKSG